MFNLETDFSFFQNYNAKIAFMIDFEKINHENLIKNIDKIKNFILRIAFKRPNLKEALKFSDMLSDCGCNISLNPMHTASYTENEYKYLLEFANKILPSSLVIVDTNGQMNKDEVVVVCKYFDNNLDERISLGFHSHNNLGLSFDNSCAFIKTINNRNLILDSSLLAMGRGAGNLDTSLIASYLNDKFNKNYNLNILNNLIDECIEPFFEQYHWGLNNYYKLSAINLCHPNYANFLIKNKIYDMDFCDSLLKKIPKEFKDVYSEKLIKEIYNNRSIYENIK